MENKLFKDFIEATTEEFRILETEYGFKWSNQSVHLPECEITYKNPTVYLSITQEAGSQVWMTILKEQFFRAARVLPIDQAVLNRAVELRQQRRMTLGDALIAGTALVHGLRLATRNTADFVWSVDPLQEKHPGLSPYAYVANNPLAFFDPNGEDIVVALSGAYKASNNRSAKFFS